MPWYEYICEVGHEFEVEERITSAPRTICLQHLGERDDDLILCTANCKRQLCKSSFSLKGGGWSGDGYAKKGN